MRLVSPLILAVCGLLFAESSGVEAAAQDGGPSSVIVNIRAVRASDPAGVDSVGERKVDERLQDLSRKFHQLPFRTFSLVAAERRLISIKRRESIGLTSGQTLTVRPLYADKERAGMWLRWQEADGAEILDTRLYVAYGESVIAGTDHAPGSGMILAIDVSQP